MNKLTLEQMAQKMCDVTLGQDAIDGLGAAISVIETLTHHFPDLKKPVAESLRMVASELAVDSHSAH